jgi:hypothetical protein
MISEQKDELEKDSSGGVHAPVFQICNEYSFCINCINVILQGKKYYYLLTMFALTIII